MTALQKKVIERVQALPPEAVEKVLSFVHSLASPPTALARPGLRGRFAHLNAHLSIDDLVETRHETWANFPRETPRE